MGIFKYFYLHVYVCGYLSIYATCAHNTHGGQKNRASSSGTGVTGSCEPSHVGSGNRILVLIKRSKCS